MAKIIYGVAGEGFGHSSRSHLIGQRLIENGHDVMLCASGKSLSYLSKYFKKKVKEISGLNFAYNEGSIAPFETLKKNIMEYPVIKTRNTRLYEEHFENFDPDVIISDFEPFSAWWAWRNNVPYISIDHEHLLTHCKLEHNFKDLFSRLTAQIVTKCYYIQARKYMVLNFFKVPTKSRSTLVVPPVLRPEVIKQTPTRGKHIVFYSTDATVKEKLKKILGNFPRQQFVIYGFNQQSEEGNCSFKKTSTEGFLKDLASSRGVIATAGFSLISECLHFRKKMLLLPVLGQYEQMTNAHYFQKLRMGMTSRKLDKKVLSDFLEIVDIPIGEPEGIIWPDNERFFRIFDRTLDRVLNSPQRSLRDMIPDIRTALEKSFK